MLLFFITLVKYFTMFYNLGMKRIHMIVKKVTRCIIPCLIALFCVFSSANSYHAENFTGNEYVFYHVSNNIRGSASGYRETTANYYIYNDTTNLKYRGVVNINFTGLVTGTFTLGLPVQFNTSDVVVTENCVVKTNSSTGVWTFQVDGVDSCTVEYYTSTYSRGLSSFSGTWSHFSDLDDINTTLGQIKGYVDGVESSLSTISNTLSTISTNLTTTNTLLAHVDNILKIQTFPVWQQNVLFWANKMGDLQFDKQMPYFYYNAGDNTNAAQNPKRIKIDPGKTVSLIFYCDSNVTANNYHIYGSQVANVTSARSISSIVPTYPLYLIKLDFTSSYTSSVFISIEFDNSFNLYPLFLGDNNLIPEDICILFGIEYNNTYTRLLQQIATGIGNISQQQIIENNTNINNYNNYQTSINNVENNYYQEFNTYENNIEQNNTFDFTGLSSDGITVYHNLFTSVFQIDLIKWPLLITLLGLIIVIILG